MSISAEKIINLRTDRGWSQEKLAAISGVSERTIQRAEKNGSCSLDTKMALAVAFEVSPSEITAQKHENQPLEAKVKIHWSGLLGLFILGLATPLIILLTASNAVWELTCLFVVWGITILLTTMTYGAHTTYRLFDNTSWLVKSPSYVNGLSRYIVQSQAVIKSAYIVGGVSSLVTALTIAIHAPLELQEPTSYMSTVLRPIIYAVLLAELWFRPYKHRMENMLLKQQ